MPPPESARTRTLRRRWRGSCASASRAVSMWSAAVFDPAFPGRSTIASGSPFPPAPWSAQAVIGWNPNVFFQVGAACSFSECAITIVASRSTVTSPPSRRARRAGQRPGPLPRGRPGGPDRLQRPRQVRRQGGDQPGHHRVGRDRPRQLRLLPQHRDVGQAVPAQRHRGGQVRDDLARVVDRPRRPPPGQPSDRPRPRPVTRIVSHSSTAPAWDTSPRPSADTATRLPRALFFTRKVPSAR